MLRVVALIDGSNLYHSIKEFDRDPDSGRALGEKHHLKWLNIDALVRALLHPTRDHLRGIWYYSSTAHWNDIDSRRRQDDFFKALEATGLTTEIRDHKTNRSRCQKCQKQVKTYVENGNDVAFASRILELAFDDAFDKMLIFTADSDFVPAVQTVRRRFPEKEIIVVTTSERSRNARELVLSASGLIKLNESHFERNLLPDVVPVTVGKDIARPARYAPPSFEL
jgi:uncharacterized LabA/DUF88 family protein